MRQIVFLFGDLPLATELYWFSHIGDISYAKGYGWLWDNFFEQTEHIASSALYHVCIRNHEYHWPSQFWNPSWVANIYNGRIAHNQRSIVKQWWRYRDSVTPHLPLIPKMLDCSSGIAQWSIFL